MNKPVFLSIIIPSYNETENLRRGVLSEVATYLGKQSYTWEVLISDDGSSDENSIKLAKDFCEKNSGFSFLQNEHAGKPFAVWSGIKKSLGEVILFTDMDQSTPIYELEKLLPYYQRGFDIVIGSRGMERTNFSVFRKLASVIFLELRKPFLLSDIIDTQAGFKSFKSSVAKELFPLLDVIKHGTGNVKGWNVTSFDVELLVAAEKRGYKIAEVPIEWADRDIAKGKQKEGSKFVSESIRMIKEIIRVKKNEMSGLYDK